MLADSSDLFELQVVELQVDYMKEYLNVLDLGTSLIDLQALISGFTRMYEDDSTYKGNVNDEIEQLYFKIDDDRKRRVKKLILDEAPSINDFELDRLSEAIDSQLLPEQRVAAKGIGKVRAYPTTSRKFSRNYSDLLQLRTFRQGSLFLEVTTTVISGLIMKFIEKIMFENQKLLNVTVNNNLIIIQDNTTYSKSVRISDFKDSGITSNDATYTSLQEYYDSILASVNTNGDNVESMVLDFLNKLADEKILSKEVIYDRKGVKTFINDIERFRGNFYDKSI